MQILALIAGDCTAGGLRLEVTEAQEHTAECGLLLPREAWGLAGKMAVTV